MPTDLEQVGRNGRKLIWKLTAGLSLAIVVIAALTISLIASVNSNRASSQSQAACQLYHDVAESPLSKVTTSFGLHISAGARVAYYRANCHLGQLAAADPRVLPLLPKGIK